MTWKTMAILQRPLGASKPEWPGQLEHRVEVHAAFGVELTKGGFEDAPLACPLSARCRQRHGSRRRCPPCS